MLDSHLGPDLNATRLHLRAITGEADPAVAWQVFADDKTRPHQARSYHGRLADVLPQLRTAQAEGFGVFVAVNETDGHGRRKENITSARAMFLDLDGTPLPDSWPVPPTLVMQSSNGAVAKFQCWWSIEPTDDFAAWTVFQKLLAGRYGGDLKCALTTQVGRAAGFYHQKDPTAPWQVKIIADNTADLDLPWSLSALAEQFGFDLQGVAAAPERTKVDEPPHGWDNAADVARARQYAAEPANWHSTSDGGVSVFKMACALRDMAIAPVTAAEIIDHFGAHAWSDDYIDQKVRNAYQYASGDAGERSAAAAGDDFEDDADEVDPPEDLGVFFADNFAAIGQCDVATIPHTPWLVPSLLLYRDVTLVGGRGGVGKSLHAWQIGISVATGKAFAWWEAPARARRVLVLSGEDDVDEIERRVSAACQSAGVDRSKLGDQFMVWRHRKIHLAIRDGKTGKISRTMLWRVVRWAIENLDVGLVIIDPLIKASAGFGESENSEMEALFLEIRALTLGHDCAVLVDDHFAKGGAGGDQAAIRGASSKVDAARVAITLVSMTSKEWEQLRPPAPVERYVRFADPKQNYGPKRGAQWLQLVDYAVGNGETRPALQPIDLAAGQDFLEPETWEHRETFLDLVRQGRSAPEQLGWPWCVSTKGPKETRLDQALVNLLGLTLKQAQAWVSAFDAEGSIVREDWISPTRNSSSVWRINTEFEVPTEYEE